MQIDNHELRSIEDPRPCPRNPRTISGKASLGLKKSIEKFGDLSGITWNIRTGNLVAGHQRVDQLKKLGAEYITSWYSSREIPKKAVEHCGSIESMTMFEEIEGNAKTT